MRNTVLQTEDVKALCTRPLQTYYQPPNEVDTKLIRAAGGKLVMFKVVNPEYVPKNGHKPSAEQVLKANKEGKQEKPKEELGAYLYFVLKVPDYDVWQEALDQLARAYREANEDLLPGKALTLVVPQFIVWGPKELLRNIQIYSTLVQEFQTLIVPLEVEKKTF